MKLGHQISGLLAFGLLIVACNIPTPIPPPAATFKLKPAEISLEIPVGGEATSFVALEREAGFTDLVQMTFENLPTGFTQEWTRDSSNGDCGVRLKVGKNVAPGTYTLKVLGVAIDGISGKNLKAQAAAITVSTNINVVVPALTGLVYTLTATPNVFSAEPGFTAKFGINVKEIDPAFSGNVQLTLENLPLGVSAVFNKNPVPTVNPPNQNTSLVTLSLANNTLPGVYAMRMVGVANGISRSTVVQLTVLPASTLGFRLSTTAIETPILQEVRSNFTVNVERKAGFTAAVVISAQGVPQDMRVENGTNTNMFMTAGLNTPSGAQNFTIKGTGGGIVQTLLVETSVLSRFEQPKATNLGDSALDSSFTNLPLAGFKTTPNINGRFNLRQPDGKILVTAGTFGIARLNADGTLDSTFNPPTALGFVSPSQFVLQADNKIFVHDNRQIIRLNPNGTLDSSFGTNGATQLSSGVIGAGVGDVLTFAQVELGRFLFITQNELIRLTPGGNLDPDFDGDGRKAITIPGVLSTDSAIALTDSLGRFIVIKDSNPGVTPAINITRILQDGTVDASYQSRPISNAGLILSSINARSRVTLDAQGRLLLLIRDVTTELYSVVRLAADGSLDLSFDTDGRIDVSFNANLHLPRAITVLANNKIMMVGAANTNDFAAVRLNQDGSLDPTFGVGGKMLLGYTNLSNSLSFDSVFTGVVGLPDSSAMAFGTGFGNNTLNAPFTVVAKFKP